PSTGSRTCERWRKAKVSTGGEAGWKFRVLVGVAGFEPATPRPERGALPGLQSRTCCAHPAVVSRLSSPTTPASSARQLLDVGAAAWIGTSMQTEVERIERTSIVDNCSDFYGTGWLSNAL